MPYTIKIIEHGIVEVVHTGRMTIKEATASRNEAGETMAERGLSNVLADVSRTEHDRTTLDLFEFNASHYDVFPSGSRLAVVIPPDPVNAEPAHFAETVAVNRGIAMKIFLSYDEAFAWLARREELTELEKK
jgi:hypothetical protein